MVTPGSITGVVLAGGKGTRMGGVDKGLQVFKGAPLAMQALLRLQMQQGGWVGDTMINANRNIGAYESFGAQVWPDAMDGFVGPLAGFLTGLERCDTEYLLTVPCDSPLFPLDMAERMALALIQASAEIAIAAAPESDGTVRPQPVFCLMSIQMLESLTLFTQDGGRKIDAWTAQHKTVLVPFDKPGDDPRAFANANSLEELRALEG
jgi:molybdopterin-guanine dinucleotide biosynthesis protein A